MGYTIRVYLYVTNLNKISGNLTELASDAIKNQAKRLETLHNLIFYVNIIFIKTSAK